MQTDCMHENHYEPPQARDVFTVQAAQVQSAVWG